MMDYEMCKTCGGGWDIGHTQECFEKKELVKKITQMLKDCESVSRDGSYSFIKRRHYEGLAVEIIKLFENKAI